MPSPCRQVLLQASAKAKPSAGRCAATGGGDLHGVPEERVDALRSFISLIGMCHVP